MSNQTFIEFIKEKEPSFIISECHLPVIDKLTAVFNGDISRLLINLPPRHSSTTLVNLFADYYKQYYAKAKITLGSRHQELAANFSKNKGFSTAIGFGKLPNEMQDLIIVDTPQAFWESNTQEAHTWIAELRDCVFSDGTIIVVTSRIDKYDVSSKLISEGGWEIVAVPAMKANGDPNFPEFWSKAALDKMKFEIPEESWNAEWQQFEISKD